MFILLYAFAALGLRPHKRFVVTSICSAGAILLFYIFTPSTVYTHFTVVAGAVMAVYLILSSVYICVTAVKHRLMGYIDSIIVCSTVVLSRLFDRRAYLLHKDILYPLLCDYIVRVLLCGHAYYKSVQNRAPP